MAVWKEDSATGQPGGLASRFSGRLGALSTMKWQGTTATVAEATRRRVKFSATCQDPGAMRDPLEAARRFHEVYLRFETRLEWANPFQLVMLR
jgi:hypothetical protein